MMQHQVAGEARFNPETLERVLRVVRHRGFQVCSFHIHGAHLKTAMAYHA